MGETLEIETVDDDSAHGNHRCELDQSRQHEAADDEALHGPVENEENHTEAVVGPMGKNANQKLTEQC